MTTFNQLPITLLDALKSDDEKIRIAATTQALWEAESIARAIWLAMGQIKETVKNLPPEAELVRDLFTVHKLATALCYSLVEQQKQLNASAAPTQPAEESQVKELLH